MIGAQQIRQIVGASLTISQNLSRAKACHYKAGTIAANDRLCFGRPAREGGNHIDHPGLIAMIGPGDDRMISECKDFWPSIQRCEDVAGGQAIKCRIVARNGNTVRGDGRRAADRLVEWLDQGAAKRWRAKHDHRRGRDNSGRGSRNGAGKWQPVRQQQGSKGNGEQLCCQPFARDEQRIDSANQCQARKQVPAL